MLELKDIGLKFDDWVLRHIDLSVGKGELLGIIGKSGAGKTSLLKLMAALLQSTEGVVRWEGEVLIGPGEKLIPGYEEIQLVNQDFALELFHTVEENIREKILHLPKEVRDNFVEELLELVEMGELRTRQARYLSGGEQQRLCIARALASEPELILLDEPFVHLDQRLRLKLVRYILDYRRDHGASIVIVSHDGAELMGLVDRVVHIEKGSIKRIADQHDMYYLPTDLEQAELMGPVNSVSVDGEDILFRPNEYHLSEEGISLTLLSAVDTGLMFCNYCSTARGEEVMLTSIQQLPASFFITIERK